MENYDGRTPGGHSMICWRCKARESLKKDELLQKAIEYLVNSGYAKDEDELPCGVCLDEMEFQDYGYD